MKLRVDLEPLAKPERLGDFVQFLRREGALSRALPPGLVDELLRADRRIGQVCVRKGWLDTPGVHRLLSVQAERDIRFGEAGVESGLLRTDQVKEAIELQENSFLLFLDSLLSFKVLVEGEIEALLQKYRDQREAPSGAAPAPERPGSGPIPVAREDVRLLLSKVRSLGGMTAVTRRVLALTEDPETSVQSLAQAVSQDSNLSAVVLRTANSAFAGSPRKISSLPEAILRVGYLGIRTASLTALAVDRFRSVDKASRRKIWLHSALTSQWARALAEISGFRPGEDAFMAGLVHDVGRSVILQEFPKAIPEIDRLIFKGKTPDEAERHEVGHTHADLGAYLAHLWSFPEPIVDAILRHHAPLPLLRAAGDPHPLVGIVHAACYLSSIPFQPYQEAVNREWIEKIDPEMRQYHQIDHRIVRYLPAIYEQAGEVAAMLD